VIKLERFKIFLTIVLGVILVGLSIPKIAIATKTYTNKGRVEYKDALGNSYVEEDTADVIKYVVSLTIAKGVGREGGPYNPKTISVKSGDIVEFQIVVTNPEGHDEAKNVVFTDTVPTGLSYELNGYGEGKGMKLDGKPLTNDADDDAGKYEEASRKITIELRDMSPGTSHTILFKARVD
jgi:fimbrial isopeptide formation D2 family protein